MTIEIALSLHSAVCTSRLEEEAESKRENVVGLWEREGKKRRESIMYLNQSISRWKLSAAFGVWGWKPDVAPSAEGPSGHQSLHSVDAVEELPTKQACLSSHSLICRVHPLPWMTWAVAAEASLERCWCKCMQRDTSSHSAFPLHSNTVTAEMEQEAARNKTRAPVFTGS